MNILNAELAATAVWPSQYPTDARPEFAFVGKSNVGKSSLINSLLNRKALARTSKQPGKTRTINFYAVETSQENAPPMYFVDLPGYGYAKIAKSESAQWGKMVESYLKQRPPLKAVLLLLDIRHAPTAHDRQLFAWCQYYHLPVLTVATKSDKLKKSRIQQHLAVIRRALGTDTPPLSFSSASGEGRDALWALMIDMCDPSVL